MPALASRSQVAEEVWGSIVSGEAEREPGLLQRLVLLAYCDLKHYKYQYWWVASWILEALMLLLACCNLVH